MDKKLGIVCSAWGSIDGSGICITEINETRIPAPDEAIETEDSLFGLLQTVQRLAISGIDFQYNAKSQNLTYKAPGAVRVTGNSVKGGFNFGGPDETNGAVASFGPISMLDQHKNDAATYSTPSLRSWVDGGMRDLAASAMIPKKMLGPDTYNSDFSASRAATRLFHRKNNPQPE